MTDTQLQTLFEAAEINTAIIKFQGEKGIVIKLRETLSQSWQSGDIIVFWSYGDNTVLPLEFELIQADLFEDD